MLQKGMFITDITQGNQSLNGIFRISDVQKQAKNNGEPFWSFMLNDATGSLSAKRWPVQGQLSPQELPENCFAQIRGVSNVYKNSMQVRIDSIQILSKEEEASLNTADFRPASPYDGADCTRELLELADRETASTPWHRLIHAFFDVPANMEAFYSASAAKCIHHAGAGGLAAHTLEVCKTSLAIASVYDNIDTPALLAGALFHDIGKLQEMETTDFETNYTAQGYLMGHLVLGVTMLAPYCRQAELPKALEEHLFHMILSHHGSIEYGAVTLPATREAMILAESDMLSAKLNSMAIVAADLAEGGIAPRTSQGLKCHVFNRLSTEQVMGQGMPQQAAQNIPSQGPVQQAVAQQPYSDGKFRKAAPANTVSAPQQPAAMQPAGQRPSAQKPAPQPAVQPAPRPASSDTPPWDDSEDYLGSLAEADIPVFEEIPVFDPEPAPQPRQAKKPAAASAGRKTQGKKQEGREMMPGLLTSYPLK